MKQKFVVLAAALAASLFGVPALAGSVSTSSSTAAGTANANNQGIGTSQSGSYSGSSAGSNAQGGTGMGIGTGGTGGYAGADVNVTYNAGDPGGSTGSGDPTINENLNGTQRLVTVGTAIAPSIYNNNSCALAASAAAGFMGGAFAFGFDRIDKGCDLRATAALLGHFSEIYSIQAAHSPDGPMRARAAQLSIMYAVWAQNLLCMQNPELAAAAPPGANVCPTVATQAGLQVVPAPVVAAVPPKQMAAVVDPPRPLAAAVAPPPPKPGHDYGPHEGAVPSSWHTGPISGYQGPDYSED